MKGTEPRRVAVAVLDRVESEGAYANLALPAALDRADLSDSDRRLVTELVYGTLRRRRACDWLVDRFLVPEVDTRVRNVLRIGAYQLEYLRVPAHAAVGTTVEVAPRRARGLVNAVLRKVADAPVEWPNDRIRLSYPDWIVETLRSDLGAERALAALEAMNEPPRPTVRADGYVQDLASQWVVAHIPAGPDDLVLDACAGPGGKATGLAAAARCVAATDRSEARAGLVRENGDRLGASGLVVAVADGRRPPFAPDTFDHVLVDAPCSGLGVLRRRPDARWRLDREAVGRLARLQLDLVVAAAEVVRPGGTLTYSVCTLTAEETRGVTDGLLARRPDLGPVAPPTEPWIPWGSGALLLPQAAGTDGMYVLTLRRPGLSRLA